MEFQKDDYQRWKTDPVTKQILKYLKDYQQALLDQNNRQFSDGAYPTEKDFYRDSERLITLNEIANLTYEDIEGFYDQASVGPSNR